ncbi:MAG TPA: glycine betaine ABC transporter substrate-binding protein [Solirubrobacterales bacterium]|jgi:osmoprotectant transport system substrate-binding protein|nr:glycine betaine ABC transporter substrate-binding protein [Solirubrobacterales bacterium]
MALAMLIAALALAVGISACGGGSSSSSSESTEAETTAPEESEAGEETTEEGEGGGEAITADPANEKISLTIGSKNFPEQEILGEIYTQALQAAGYDAKSDLSLGSETVALKTLKAGKVSGYPEYASTALTAFFGLEPEEVPSGATPAWEKANAEFEKEGLTAFKPTPFESANAVGLLKSTAEKYNLKTISDLKGVSEKLSLYGSPECEERIDCLAGLEKYYGLKFKEFKPVDIELRYTVLEKGQADLSILFTTDPKLAAEEDKFVILEDDKHVFPAGNVIFVTSQKVAKEAGPDYQKTVEDVQSGLTLKVMQELDAVVELERETPKEAAAAYLEAAGYVE